MKKLIQQLKCFFKGHVPNQERNNFFNWSKGNKTYDCHCTNCGTKMFMNEDEGNHEIMMTESFFGI